MANWAIALIAVLAFFAAIVLLVRLLIGKTGQLFKRLFPQLDEDGFRQKALRQCETTRSYIGLSKQEIVDFDLDHKFLEEVDGELRKEGIVYNRYDEQIDDWVRDYLGLATARPTTPKVGQLERFFKFLHRHGW